MINGQDYILVDDEGSRTRTSLVDMDDRKSYRISPSMNRPHQMALQIFRTHAPRYVQGVQMSAATISFGPQYGPGDIWMEGWTEPIPMEEFFSRASLFGK